MTSKSPKKQDEIALSGFLCWVALVLVLIGAAVIRGRLLAVPLERDEGEYAYIAQQMLKGVPPYASAYSMKLPGIYVIYALILAAFGQTHTAIHLGLVIFNATTIFVIFLLARRLFDGPAAVAASAAYAIMSLALSVQGLSANAEHFVVLPALIGITLIVGPAERRKLAVVFIAALLLGLAFIIKQHGIFFAVFGAVYLLYCNLRHRPIQWKNLIISQLVFAAGVCLPFALTCILLWQAGVFDKFWFWTFTYAREYAAKIPLSAAPKLFAVQFMRVVTETVLIWVFALPGLVTVIVVKHYRRGAVFVVGLLVFSFLAICPGFYFRGHYFIFLLPAVAVLTGAGFAGFSRGLSKLPTWLSGYFCIGRVIVFVGLAVVGFSLFQQRNYLFYKTPAEVSRLIYGGNPFPESPRIAEFIRANCADTDTVAVLGSEPQIYFYSGRRAATHYIYMYPLMEMHDYAPMMQKEMIGEIESAKPELMVFVSVSTSWLSRPDSVKLISEWLNSYGPKFYDLVGVIDIVAANRTIYRWDQQAAGYKPTSDHWVTVYKRKH